MSYSTGVHDAQEFPVDASQESYTRLSLSSEESVIMISPPRSPSRLDFFHEEEDPLDHSKSEADAEIPISRVKWARGLFRSGPAREKFMEDDEDEDDNGDAPLVGLPILHMNNYCMNTQTNLEDEPSAVPPPLRTVAIEPLAPEPVRHATLPQEPKMQVPTPVSRITTQRLNYPNHGFSRSAFLHQKSFWTARHDEWLEWQAREVKQHVDHGICAQDPRNAYAGIIGADSRQVSGPPSQFRAPPSGLERDCEEYASRVSAQDLNAPIYPRVGDISALRDPYSANVDRCFFKFPLWTLHKTLYVFDMYQRAALTTPEPMNDSGSLISIQSYAGSTSSSDEDLTLVADDEMIFDKTTVENGAHQRSLPPETPKGSPPCPWKAIRAWELSWYARWELLIGLVQRDQALRQTAPLSPSMTPSGSVDDQDGASQPELLEPFTPEALAPIFHFAGEDGEGDSFDEEDDYGALIANPMYSKTFEEGYHRAVKFFSKDRELKREPRLRTVTG